MSRHRFVVLAIPALAAVAVLAGGGVARADAPAPGDTCTVFHATTHDVNGRTMWCNPTVTDAHNLMWQYGEPS